MQNDSQPTPPSAKTGLRWTTIGLAALGLLTIALLWIADSIPQDPSYHAFADRREWLSIPNFGDVVSNAPFLLVGIYGIAWLLLVGHRSALWRALLPWERLAWISLFVSLSTVAVGSAYYHWAPTTPRLFWDRLPMAVTFMTFFALLMSDRLLVQRGGRLWLILSLVGIGSVVYWRQTELAGKGDLRPYILVQFIPILVLPILLALRRGRSLRTSHLVAALAFYVLAKVLELLDAAIFKQLGVISGHSLKHLAAAAGGLFIVTALTTARRSES